MILEESVASPTTIVRREKSDSGRRACNLLGDRTYAVTTWLWARRAGMRRRPRLPVAPRRRTREAGLEGGISYVTVPLGNPSNDLK
jgi:hypothetical protein